MGRTTFYLLEQERKAKEEKVIDYAETVEKYPTIPSLI